MVSTAAYYFRSSGTYTAPADIMLGFQFAWCKNLGSLAMASFIIALVQFIKLIFLYFAQKASDANPGNKCVEAVICVGKCLINCLEKITDYIN